AGGGAPAAAPAVGVRPGPRPGLRNSLLEGVFGLPIRTSTRYRSGVCFRVSRDTASRSGTRARSDQPPASGSVCSADRGLLGRSTVFGPIGGPWPDGGLAVAHRRLC